MKKFKFKKLLQPKMAALLLAGCCSATALCQPSAGNSGNPPALTEVPEQLEPVPPQKPVPPAAIPGKAADPARYKASPKPGRGKVSFHQGLFEEDVQMDAEQAVDHYEDTIAEYDKMREVAGKAMLRLAETLRKQGRSEESARYYERLIHEFGDNPALIKAVKDRLPQLAEKLESVKRAQAATTEQTNFVRQKRDLVKQQMALVEKQMQEGKASQEDKIRVEMALVDLEEKMAKLQSEQATMAASVADAKQNIETTTARAANTWSGAAQSVASTAGGGVPGGSAAGNYRTAGLAGSYSSPANAREMENRLSQLEIERQELESRMKLVAEASSLADFPASARREPRFRQLSELYESTVLQPGNTVESEKKQEELARLVMDKIMLWKEKFYLPQLKAELRELDMQAAALKKGLDRLNNQPVSR